ncbi:acyltransferase family protein [Kaistia adipata]|uniref:acyltransferase family protein n=1 Tax=Kaistia adipata TaxID=166954 RepID=UPI00042547EE|nr:acyltransferase family protein [Kaistia adipata]
MTATSAPDFRYDINGLRAWAVLAVILYHFDIAGFSGGFVGVDVFFVISGFLMAGIVVNGATRIDPGWKSQGRFLLEFYLARGRRIIPALAVVCFAVLAWGWLHLAPQDLEQLGRHAHRAILFRSNIGFAKEAGYFDAASIDKPLLHTWSLGVEWQFYLLFPLVVLIFWRLRPGVKWIAGVLALIAIASFLYSLHETLASPANAFFRLPSRAWELLAGALAYCAGTVFARSARLARGLELAGFTLIIGAIFLVDATTPWPGSLAVVPVAGAVMVLLAARQGSLLTAPRPLQWIGSISYSLYLWHWPIVTGLYYYQLAGAPAAVGAGLVITLVCGWLSYRFIEQPARKGLRDLRPRGELAALAIVLLMVFVPGQIIRQLRGVPVRFSEEVRVVFSERSNTNPRIIECQTNDQRPVPECTYGGPKLGAIVIGDSHAGAVIRSVEKALPDTELHVLDWTRSGCSTIAGLHRRDGQPDHCGDFVDLALEKGRKLPPVPLIIVNRTSSTTDPGEPSAVNGAPFFLAKTDFATRSDDYFAEIREAMLDTACTFARHRPVYYLRPIPEMPRDVPKHMGLTLRAGQAERVSISMEEYRKRNAFVWSAQDEAAARCGVKILDPLPYLCRDGRCWGDVDGRPIYYDDDHLSERGGAQLIPIFRSVFKPDLQAARSP